jgi:DNA polymerase-3 subunit delta'
MWQIIGQARAVSLLERGLETGSLAHAYLLIGPEHAGKMTLAANLAQALNCESTNRPCLECPACKKIAAGNHADVQVIGLLQNDDSNEAKLISTEQIKDMLHQASLPPFEGRHKVFIINGAELLSTEAANRLLKNLEEPVANVTFILLTTNDRLLPETVVSRCQRLEVAPLPVPAEAAALEKRWGVPAGQARLLAGLSHGCLGWAVTASGDETLLQQRGEQLDRLVEVVRGDYEKRFAYASQLAAGFSQRRGAVYAVLDLWLDYWRDLLLAKLGCQDAIINTDRQGELAALAGRFRLADIKEFIKNIEAAAGQLRQNVNPKLALEVLMLDIPGTEGDGAGDG